MSEENGSLNHYALLQEKLSGWLPLLSDAADTIINQGISDYPVFVISNDDLEIGVAMTKESGDKLKIKASTLEEFVARRLISPEKVEEFKAAYKAPDVYICISVIAADRSEIIFLPR